MDVGSGRSCMLMVAGAQESGRFEGGGPSREHVVAARGKSGTRVAATEDVTATGRIKQMMPAGKQLFRRRSAGRREQPQPRKTNS